jgi:preprotein translocase subunit YajC
MRVFFFQINQHAMTKMFLSLEMPAILAQQTAPGGNAGYSQLIFFGLLFAAMYFLMIAPQRKKQKAHEKMLSELSSGDEIVTTGGIYGTITNVKEDRFVVRVADDTKIEVGKAFVSTVVKRDAKK